MARDNDFIIKILMNSSSSRNDNNNKNNKNNNNNNNINNNNNNNNKTKQKTKQQQLLLLPRPLLLLLLVVLPLPSLLSTVLFHLFGFDGGVVKVSDGAHSKYSGRCLNLVYANFVKAVFASDGSRNSTMPVNKTD